MLRTHNPTTTTSALNASRHHSTTPTTQPLNHTTQAGAFKIGDTAGTLDNIIACKLYRPGSVGFVSKSGGMSNELYNVLSRATDGLYEGAPRARAHLVVALLCRVPVWSKIGVIMTHSQHAPHTNINTHTHQQNTIKHTRTHAHTMLNKHTHTHAGIAIGGDTFPGSTLSDHCIRYQNIPQIKMIVVLGELGGTDEYSLVNAMKEGASVTHV